MNLGAVMVSAFIAFSAIVSATLAVLHGSIDGAAFTGIIGSAIGAAGAGAAHAVVVARNGGNGKQPPTLVVESTVQPKQP